MYAGHHPSACVDVQAAYFSIVCSPHAKIFPFGKIHKKKHKIFPFGNKNAGSESWRLRCFRFLKKRQGDVFDYHEHIDV